MVIMMVMAMMIMVMLLLQMMMIMVIYSQPEQLFQHSASINFAFFLHSPFFAQSAQFLLLSTHGAVDTQYE